VLHDDLNPEEYQARSGITKDEYETRALAGAREYALSVYPPGSTAATIETIRLDGDGLDTSLVILFRIPARPECRWGYRDKLWPAPWEEFDGSRMPEEYGGSPEGDGAWAVVIGVGEHVDQGGLGVRDCSEGEITWLR
jgi:hypothetical protein